MSRVSAPRRDRLPPPQTFRVMALKHKVLGTLSSARPVERPWVQLWSGSYTER
jgi:hypothetical protein